MSLVETLKKRITWEFDTADPITIGDKIITPRSQALHVQSPFGGFVWNRPVSVLVEQGGQGEEIPIVDVTRMAQLALMVGAAMVTLLLWTARVSSGEK